MFKVNTHLLRFKRKECKSVAGGGRRGGERDEEGEGKKERRSNATRAAEGRATP